MAGLFLALTFSRGFLLPLHGLNHSVFLAPRRGEVAIVETCSYKCPPFDLLQLAGATYMDVHAQGGGIHYTVQCVRQASSTELYESLLERLVAMARAGTTTVEAKSGYGLNLEAEVKQLEVLEWAKKKQPLTISCTYCGAHAVPK